MERRRLIRGLPRRTTAGVSALIAAALGFALLVPGQEDGPSPSQARPAHATALLDESSAQERAVRTGKRVEVTALRDATSTTYALPDGDFELTAHAVPVRAKVGDTWKPIDTTLTRTKDGWAPKAAADPVIFSDGAQGAPRPTNSSPGNTTGRAPSTADRASYSVSRASRLPMAGRAIAAGAEDTEFSDLVTFTSAGHVITLGWPGPLPVPTIDGASALYTNVFDGVDLLLTARDSGFSHVLVVHSPEAAASGQLAELPYMFSSPDLTFHLDPITHAVSAKDAKGEEIAVSPTPYMWDSAGKLAVTEGDDPQPPAPSADPAPTYSEEPGEPVSDNPEGGDTDGNAAPDPLPSEPSQSPAPSTVAPPASPVDPSESPDDQTAVHNTALSGGSGDGSLKRLAGFSTTGSSYSPQDVFALPGLEGPQPGTHAAVGTAALAGQGTTSALLTMTPNKPLLTDEKTVWPVFIDPSITGQTANWTTTYQKHPDSSFYDGANYNTGTTEARVGWESTTNGLSRSFFHLNWKTNFKGAAVSSAYIQLLETYAWSCEEREMQVWQTAAISSATTWNKQPQWMKELGRKSFANGWKSSCPDAYVTYDMSAVKALAQDAADGGWTNITIGLKATNEESSYSWKKFKAETTAAPKMVVKYNRRPKEPTGLSMTPGVDCDLTSPYSSVGLSDLTFAAQSSDPDGDLKYIDFEVWESGKTTKIYDGNRTVDSQGKASITLDGGDGTASSFANGKTYFWRPRAIDSTGAASTYAPPGTDDCGFVYDSTAPASPEVSSDSFPEPVGTDSKWSTVKLGTKGEFTFQGSADTVEYRYKFNTTSNPVVIKPSSPGAAVTVLLAPPVAGPNVLFVWAVDAALNISPTPRKYLHYVTPRATADAPGDVTGDSYPDLLAVDSLGDLRSYPGDSRGDIATHSLGAHDGDDPAPDGYWVGSDGAHALITHMGDQYPGDGLTDLVARMPDGRLYTYPGDGYGGFDINERLTVDLPSNAPAPATLTEIVSTPDITGDGLPDMFALAGDQLWAFTGYTGATFTEARQLAVGSWDERNIVSVGDISGDGIADLLWRGDNTGRGLSLRQGKPAAGGGVDLASLALGATSATGQDETYGTGGWSRAEMPLIKGTPDATGDGIPDIWGVEDDGKLYFYPGGKATHGTRFLAGEAGWMTLRILG